MFRIPKQYKKNLNLNDAVNVIKIDGWDVLGGMQRIDSMWDAHNEQEGLFADDDDFFYQWALEVNAYNVIYKAGQKLFFGA